MTKKLLSEAATSKPARQHAGSEDRPHLVSPRKAQLFPKSFRLGVVHLDRLRRLSDRLSEEVGRSITETEILKGLLLLGEKTDTRKLLTAVKDAVFDGI